jgi:hypothetical protein
LVLSLFITYILIMFLPELLFICTCETLCSSENFCSIMEFVTGIEGKFSEF